MTGRYCMLCGTTNGPFEGNHWASKIAHVSWEGDVCIICHRIFTAWQWADRIPWWKNEEPPEEVKHDAIVLGLIRAAELASFRMGDNEAVLVLRSFARQYQSLAGGPAPGRSYKSDGSFAKPKITKPIPVPHPSNSPDSYELIMAAFYGMCAYLIEEARGEDYPVARAFRKAERDPMRYDDRIRKTGKRVQVLVSLGKMKADEIPAAFVRMMRA